MPKKKSNESIKNIILSVAKKDYKEKKEEELIQLAVFELDNEEYGIVVDELREIIRMTEITSVPGAPEFVKGILNLRGKIVVVVDLEKKFNLVRESKTNYKHIVITEIDESYYGIIVDNVKDVLRIPVSSIRKTPNLTNSRINKNFLSGVVVLKNSNNKKTESYGSTKDKNINKQKGRAENAKNESRLIILLKLKNILSEKEVLELGDTAKKIVK